MRAAANRRAVWIFAASVSTIARTAGAIPAATRL